MYEYIYICIQNTKYILFTPKTKSMPFNYHVADDFILRTECVKYLGLFIK
jgi:hypothetical protein